MDDAALAYRAQHGERDSFEMLVYKHAGTVANYLRRFMPDGDDRDDLFQEVFLKAYINLHQFDQDRGSFRSWLMRIATTTSLDELKRMRREEARNGEGLLTPTALAAESSDRVERDESVRGLRSVLMSLPDSERQVIVLSFYHDLKFREISSILDIPLGTVKSRMRSAMSRLKRIFTESEVGELR